MKKKSSRPLVSKRRIRELLGQEWPDLCVLANQAGGMYRSFDRETKPGKWRHIDAPDDDLKKIQKRIKKRILDRHDFPPELIGGIPERSGRDGAEKHQKQQLIIALDVQNFFPSISNRRVYQVFREVYGCSSDIASILTKLTTLHRRLPQGTPTSSQLANAIMIPVVEKVRFYANKYECNVTVYVDDITISGKNPHLLIDPIARILSANALTINRSKTNFMKKYFAQRVYGFTVNEKVTAGTKYVRSVMDLINELSTKPNLTDKDVKRALGKIEFAKFAHPAHADYLKARLEEKVGTPNIVEKQSKKNFNDKPCKHLSKCRARLTREPKPS